MEKVGDGTSYAIASKNMSTEYKSGIYCYPNTQTVWDSIMDAFEISLVEGMYSAEYMPEYQEYGKYGILVSKNGKNLVNIPDMNISYTGQYTNYFPEEPRLLLQPSTTYTISFNYIINSATETIKCGIGYGTARYSKDLVYGKNYPNQTQGRFEHTFSTPETFLSDYIPYLQLRLARTDSSSYKDVDISNIQVEIGSKATEYQQYAGMQKNIYSDSPLKDGEYIDFKKGKVVRADGTEEYIDLPELQTFEDYTEIEVLTEVKPSRIEIEYVGYTFE